MDNSSKQVEELEALVAIYGNELQVEDEANRAYSIIINHQHIYVQLYVKMLPNYPSSSPPKFEISAPYLSKSTKIMLRKILKEEYLSYIGEPVIFQWVEKIRQELTKIVEQEMEKTESEESESEVKKVVIKKCPEIFHGDIITDRKSTFQGHVAVVTSEAEISMVLEKLKNNKKISNASHNVLAYRIMLENNCCLKDYDDDGENQAGIRLLRYLDMIDARNILLVVSRWYGGIHLGADRFKHYVNAGRQVLVTSNLMPVKKCKKS